MRASNPIATVGVDPTTEVDITMFRFMQRFGRDRQARGRGTGQLNRVRRRNHPLNCEALEGRQLLSAYYIVNEASGKVLDDPGSSTDTGADIDQWGLNGGTNQLWNILPVGNGNDEIVNVCSNKALTVIYSSSGPPIIQDQWYGVLSQQWTVTLGAATGNGNYVNVGFKNAYSGMWLDDPMASQSNGTHMIQWPLDYGANQQWTLVAAEDPSDAITGQYYFVNASSGQGLGGTQLWDLVQLADGAVLIVNDSSGEVLDDPDFSTTPGTHIQLYQPNGGLNQQWQLDDLQAGGPGYIYSAYNDLVLDDPTGTGQLVQDNQAGSLTQNWLLSTTPFTPY
jgi:Ricin-type beta-trefoil lectin domain-like